MNANPGKITFVNQNAAAQVTGNLLKQATGQKVRFIPYRGAGPAMTDLVSGQVDRACLFSELGLDVAPDQQQTPEGLASFHKAEIEKWWPIIKAVNVKPE
jgi:hypothetical protein